MAKRLIVRRRSKGSSTAAKRAPAKPLSRRSFGLKPDEHCELLIVGGANYCSFTLARLGRLGISGNTGVTDSQSHAVWAASHLAPKVIISSIDYGRKSGGIDLMRKLEVVNPEIAVILTSSAFDPLVDGRALRDLAWSMGDSWSFVTRRKTDNGDPLGVAIASAKQGLGWVDFTVRKQIQQWRDVSAGKPGAVAVAV